MTVYVDEMREDLRCWQRVRHDLFIRRYYVGRGID